MVAGERGLQEPLVWPGRFAELASERRVHMDRAPRLAGQRGQFQPHAGIRVDPKDDLVELTLEDLDHLIHHPREIYVDYNVGGLITIEIVTADDVREIIKLKDPLMLPAPVQG